VTTAALTAQVGERLLIDTWQRSLALIFFIFAVTNQLHLLSEVGKRELLLHHQ